MASLEEGRALDNPPLMDKICGSGFGRKSESSNPLLPWNLGSRNMDRLYPLGQASQRHGNVRKHKRKGPFPVLAWVRHICCLHRHSVEAARRGFSSWKRQLSVREEEVMISIPDCHLQVELWWSEDGWERKDHYWGGYAIIELDGV